jgi:hypothetical protein
MLKGEKEKAHDGEICSVDVSADGAKIVSGGRDKAIKVWGAAPVPFVASEWEKAEPDDDGDILWTNTKTQEQRWQYYGEDEPTYGAFCKDSNPDDQSLQTLIVPEAPPDTTLVPSGENCTDMIAKGSASLFSALRSSVAVRDRQGSQLTEGKGGFWKSEHLNPRL